MSNGAVMNYDFGPKRNWRRWVWNRIVERLTVPPREALVFYLAGANDFDRQIAMSRGFASENLVAIERASAARRTLREAGVLTVGADISDEERPNIADARRSVAAVLAHRTRRLCA